jgi:hypothetical protein
LRTIVRGGGFSSENREFFSSHNSAAVISPVMGK